MGVDREPHRALSAWVAAPRGDALCPELVVLAASRVQLAGDVEGMLAAH